MSSAYHNICWTTCLFWEIRCRMGCTYITLKSHLFPCSFTGEKVALHTPARSDGLIHPSVTAGTFWLIPDPICPLVILQNIEKHIWNFESWQALSVCHATRWTWRKVVICISPSHFRYSNILSPYSKAVPAIIAKASTIYNPFIYAIIHNKYRWIIQISVIPPCCPGSRRSSHPAI